MQDIFYDSSCGLLIPIWHSDDTTDDDNINTCDSILRVDISNIKKQKDLNPKSVAYVWPLEFTGISTKPLVAKFEFESIAFVKKNKNGDATLKFTISCNIMLDTNPKESMDCIIELKNIKNFLLD